MRALIYLRNSSDKQARAGTIAAQRPDCLARARQLGADEMREYVDEGRGGDLPVSQRPGLLALLAEARAGDVVIAFALDRLCRADDWIDTAAIYGALQRAAAVVEAVQEGRRDPGDEMGRLMLMLDSGRAAKEKKLIKARTAAGRARVLAAGGKPYARTPYGLTYDQKAKRWGIDEAAAAVLREAKDLRVGGASWNAIGAELERRGVIRKGSSKWPAEAVYRLIMSPTYRGRWHANGVEVPVPAIFSDLDGARLDALCDEAKRACRKGRSKAAMLLDGGVAVCGKCGSPVYVHNAPTRGGAPLRYYVCRARLRPARGAARCPAPYFPVEDLDAAVWRRVVERFATDGEVEITRTRRERAEGAAADRALHERDLADATGRREALRGREAVLVDEFTAGRISREAMQRGTEKARALGELLDRQVAQARAGIAAVERRAAGAARGPRSRLEWRARIEGADGEARRGIVRECYERVILDEDGIRAIEVDVEAEAYVYGSAESSNSREPDTAAVPVRIQLDRR